ncbi:MAG: glycosyltransferase family 2 protein [Prevotella sp.]
MKTAIVILNWNGEKMLRRFLPDVLKHSAYADTAVYVADNASTDNSLDMLAREFPEVKTIVLDTNWGFAEGYNRALSQIDAEYYVLLNSDVEVTAGWLLPLVGFMDAHSDVAACQPKLLSESARDTFEYAGACGGFIDKYGYPFCRGRMFDTVEKDRGQYDGVSEVMWATGACMMVRADDYKRVGGMDKCFFAHCEEIDLCWRLRISGRKIYCVPQSKVYHVGGGTLPKNNPMKTYLNFRNNLTMLYKNLPENRLKKVMRARLLLDALAALQALLSGRIGDFKAIIKGRMDYNRRKPQYAGIRQQIQALRSDNGADDTCDISILWYYYIKGKRLFSMLSGSVLRKT